ncbi:hypothetical protein QMG83_11610 [Salinibacterium sp. G-O1]|uniref:hypothetical protein n=1 Tax=Salinibacterium sp. G-O1 TaxID=3046208 RepID=UPI0024B8BABD|nr:hypothetical protein [Salinibacterium sp. G-O1]MDJ0335872.1 hypothetical protein [Salinibacterium sp. G-O1]
MSERHTAATEVEQQLVFDLMRERLIDMFGPGGSFRISMGRPAADDAFFVATVADTIAHEVAAAFNPVRTTEGRRVAETTPMAEHEKLWKHIEGELGIKTTGPATIAADVDREVAYVQHRTILYHAA